MTAHDFAPVRPLSKAPDGPPVTPDEAKAAILDALRPVVLGTHDLHLIRRAAETLDTPTLRVLVSWLLRVRHAAHAEALEHLNSYFTAAGQYTAADVARGRAHDVRTRRWPINSSRRSA